MATAGSTETAAIVWYCEMCQQVSFVKPAEERADIMSVMYQMEDDHEATSPECLNSVEGLRTVNQHHPRWQQEVPEWVQETMKTVLPSDQLG